MFRRTLLLALTLFFAAPLRAAPLVVADIAPVQSLVAKVMAGVGEPHLLLSPGASPHDYALKPSDARALSRADIVVWIGPALTPWLEAPLDVLAPDALRLTLNEADGTTILEARAEAVFGDDHDHDHGADDGHGLTDPHSWLDPENARVWVAAIAEALADLDPDNAATYRANAALAQTDLAALEGELAAALAPQDGKRFLVFHDAYQYFEARFDLTVLGAISLTDGAAPSPARIDALRARVAEQWVACAFAEPQFSAGLIDAVQSSNAVPVGILDPMGASVRLGPDHYDQTLRALAAAIAECTD